jgi:multiple sugar transport system substrate-binding protein
MTFTQVIRMVSASIGGLAVLMMMNACTRPPEADGNRIQFAFWGSVQQQRAEEEIIRAFEAAHPDIKVDILPVGARYAEKMQAMFVGNVAPDVVMVNLFNYDEWAARGVLLDLTEDFRMLAEEAEFLPIPRRIVERDGRVFALPINAHGSVTFFNSDALKKAGIELPEEGITWSYLEEIAPRLASRRGDPDAPTDYLMLMPPANIVFWQYGVSLFDDPFHPNAVTVNTPEAVEAINFLRRISATGYVVPPEVAADEGTFQLFRDGRVAFYFNGRWMTPEFTRTSFEWDVIPFPAGPVSGVTSHGGTTLAVWSNSRRQEAARQFVRFYASYRGAEIAMHWQRNVPVFREVAYGEKFLSLRPPENMAYFSKTMEDGAAQFDLYAPGSSEVLRIFQSRIQQALSRPQLPAEVVLSGMEEDLNRWLQKMKARRTL